MRHYHLLTCLIFLLGTTVLPAQSYLTTKTISKKVKEWYNKARGEQRVNPDAAIKGYLKVIKKEPTFINPYVQLGYIHEQQKKYDKATEYFNKVIALGPDYNPNIYMALGRIAMATKDYDGVEKHLTQFLTYEKRIHPKLAAKAEKRIKDAQFRKQALANPVAFEPKNLGQAINTQHREYFPSLTLNNELVYTMQIGDQRRGQEDLYISKQVNGEWSQGAPIPNVNTSDNEGAQSISADGKLLVFTVCNKQGDYGSCDLYYSRKVNNKWTRPQNIGAPINSANWESQPSIAPNSDAIYFVRGGARGQGHKDLYISKLQADGTWGTPENIQELNTPNHESAPFIHPDGQTLYFSSDGHPGMGGLDLFVSRKQKNGQWGAPENLGYPLNTSDQEEALAVNRIGSLAYLASNREGGYGSLDIYGFELPKHALPAPVTYIKGLTLDAETNDRLSAEVEIINLATKERFMQLQTPANGEFTVCLPTGEYALNAKKDGYLLFSANYNLSEPKLLEKAYPLQARLQPIVYKGDDENKKVIRQPIVLENVFFETASAALKDASKVELNKLKEMLEQNPTVRIQLNGHTDNVGEDTDNLKLSNDRAYAVLNYLVAEGIAKERLQAKGYGETKPRASNESPEGRANNRRTEFEIILD